MKENTKDDIPFNNYRYTIPIEDVFVQMRQRLEKFRECIGLNAEEFCERAKCSKGTYSHQLNHGKTISKSFVQLVYHYKDLNCNWLFRGEGPMTNTEVEIKAGQAFVAHEEQIERQIAGLPIEGPSYDDPKVSEYEPKSDKLIDYLIECNKDQRELIEKLTMENISLREQTSKWNQWYTDNFRGKENK